MSTSYNYEELLKSIQLSSVAGSLKPFPWSDMIKTISEMADQPLFTSGQIKAFSQTLKTLSNAPEERFLHDDVLINEFVESSLESTRLINEYLIRGNQYHGGKQN